MKTTRSSRLGVERFHRLSPWRTPAWRWLLAESLHRQRRKPAALEDPALAAALVYRRALDRATTDAKRQAIDADFPHLAGARAIHLAGGRVRNEIEARLLAGEDFDRIAAKTGVPSGVVREYESVFFNVTDSPAAMQWLMGGVLQIHTWSPGKPTMSQTWQWVALAAGSYLLDLLIAEDLGRAEPQVVDRQRIAERVRFCVRDAITPMTTSDSFKILKEGAELFGWASKTHGDSAFTRDPMAEVQLEFVRLAAGKSAKATRQRKRASQPQEAVRQPALNGLKERHGGRNERSDRLGQS